MRATDDCGFVHAALKEVRLLQADIAMTREVIEAAKVLGLSVHDHVIVGRDGLTSFRAQGLI